MFLILGVLANVATTAFAQDDAPFRLAVPQEMIDSGFTQHLLPRFRFKTRISIDPVARSTQADAEFSNDTTYGQRMFSGLDGTPYHLALRGEGNETTRNEFRRFQEWLQSDPGIAAIEGFETDGSTIYTVKTDESTQTEVEIIDGDVAAGSKLALQHCGRCHVIDKRNRMGGIGSTPSFAALRTRGNWPDLFRVFWSENPHPSFTQVKDVTEPFPPERPVHIAPVEITLEEIDAIVAFVATLEPKNLGQPVAGQ